MNFPIPFYLLAFAGAFLASALSLPLWRRFSLRFGLIDDPGHRKIHSSPVPLAGGLAVLTGLFIPIIVGLAWLAWDGPAEARELLIYGVNKRFLQLTIILAGASAMFVVGLVDDRFELGPTLKFSAQVIIAVATAAAGVRITLFIDNVLFSYIVTALWILTITNAFNFMDNMNGLCGGLGFIAGFYFALSAALHGQYLVAILALLVCGSLLGFLPYNFPKAKVFLGDAGSHLIGYLAAVSAILPHFYSPESPNALAVLAPLLILLMPLLDLVSVVIIRLRSGKPFYIGDTNHFSHRLVRHGYSRTQAVLILWLGAAVAGAMSFLLSAPG